MHLCFWKKVTNLKSFVGGADSFSKVNSYERVYEIEFKLFCWDLSEWAEDREVMTNVPCLLPPQLDSG